MEKVILQPVVNSISTKTVNGVFDLSEYEPAEPSCFEIVVEICVGINLKNGQAEEHFEVTVCTPQWIANSLKENDVLMGHGLLITTKYSYLKVVEKIESYVKRCYGNRIDDVIRRVGLLGEWEAEWEINLVK